MRRVSNLLKLGSLIILALVFCVRTLPAHAAYNHNLIMSDVVFDDYNAMTAAQIDAFLNTFPSSCLSTHNGFTSPDVTGYTPHTGFTYGTNVSGGTVIYHASQAYGLSPRVILATLQKESSVVSGDASYHCQYINTAMGFDCPDSGSCPQNPATESGFSKQVIHAAWMLRFHEQRSEGNIAWQETKPGWDNSDDPQSCYSGRMTQGTYQLCPSGPSSYFDGWYTIDGSATHMDNGPTAALYDYTPHFSGNQHFVTIFENWFGSTQTNIPFAWSFAGGSAFSNSNRTLALSGVPTTTPGGTIYVRVRARNVGNQTWLQNVLIGTNRPNNRVSQFADSSWGNNGTRPAHLLESSVKPGQTGTFEFTMKAPATTGSYKENFNLLIENQTWFNDLGMYFNINVVSPTAAATVKNILHPDEFLLPGQMLLSPDRQSVLVLQPDGNLVLYEDFVAKWNSHTAGTSPGKLIMQGSDGNLVLYDRDGVARWDANTNGNPNAYLKLQTDGNLVVYRSNNTPLWSVSLVHNPDRLSYVDTKLPTGILYPGQQIQTADRKYRAVLQSDGNFVLYAQSGAIWSSRTHGKPVVSLNMQPDGNLVLRDKNGGAIWYTKTHWYGPSYLTIQPDGNLVLRTLDGKATWNSQTAGMQ